MDTSDFLVFAPHPIVGASHVKNGKPCQDFSVAWQSEDKQNLAIIVCDGHGSDTYVRSDAGAKFAAKAALDAIQELIAKNPDWILGKKGEVTAREADERLRYDISKPENLTSLPETEQQRYAQRCMFVRQVKDIAEQDAVFEKLFRTIYEKWTDAIEKDTADRPFTDVEKAALGNRRIAKAYGSTLMVYVQTPLYWFAFHIGDGRILACNRRIKWKQLVPWDTACFLNFTTSLCNTNPVPSFRYAFDATGNFPSAVFCCSDGIEDSWGDYEVAPERLHNYYSNLIRVFYDEGKDSTIQKLEDFLPILSEKGSKDDMSLAGYINLKAIANGIKIIDLKHSQASLEKEKSNRSLALERLKKDIVEKEAEILKLKSEFANAETANTQADKAGDELRDSLGKEIDRLYEEIKVEKESDKAQWKTRIESYGTKKIIKYKQGMKTEKIYIGDYTKDTFYDNPDIPDEYKLDCALSVLKYMLENPDLFIFYYYTVSYNVIFYLNKLFVQNYNNPKNGWKEKADLYFKYFSVLREPRNEKALEAIGIDPAQLPKSKFGSRSEDEVAEVCAREFIGKIDFSYIFEGKNDIGIFRRDSSQFDENQLYIELIDSAFNQATHPIILKSNAKYMSDQYKDMIPYIAYQDVMENRCRIRAYPLEGTPTFTSSDGEVIAEYDSTSSMIEDGWRVD